MLFVKESLIPNAGQGLFTDADIQRGETVAEYTGDIRTWKECLKKYEEGKGLYFYYVNRNHVIDAYEHVDSMARYANDAAGASGIKGITNNCVYEERGKRVYIVAIRKIKAGAEILVTYGQQYWSGDEFKE